VDASQPSVAEGGQPYAAPEVAVVQRRAFRDGEDHLLIAVEAGQMPLDDWGDELGNRNDPVAGVPCRDAECRIAAGLFVVGVKDTPDVRSRL